MKKHSILKVVLFTILVIALCTWIFPSAQFQNGLVEGERIQAGIFDLFTYPMVALQYFGSVVLYVVACGMFYGVCYRLNAYHALVEKIATGFKGMENFFFGIVITLIAAIVSVTGISLPIIFVFPFIIDVVKNMGYNKLVAATVTVGPTVAGIAGTTLGVLTTGYMNQVLNISSFSEMITKVVILVIFIILLIAQVVLYGKKTKNDTIDAKKEETKDEVKEANEKKEVENVEEIKSSNKKPASEKTKNSKNNSKSTSNSKAKKNDEKKPSTSKRGRPPKTRSNMARENSETLVISTKPKKKANIWPLVIIFDLVLIILALATFDWSGLFEITWFKDAADAVLQFEVLDFPIFGKLLGQVEAFGSWSLNLEVPALIMIATCILALVYRVKWNDFIDGICDGFRSSLEPAVVMLLTYVVLVLVTYHPFQLTITKFLLDITSGINVVTMTIAAFVSSLLNVDLVYVTQSTLPYVGSVITDTELYPLIGVIFQAIYGLVALVAPTSFILMGTLSYLDISYKQWLKHIWKLFLVLLAVLVVIFLVVLAL